MAAIFLSYRRDDSPDVCDRIHDQLVRRFGAKNTFRDVDAIPLGSDFKQTLDIALQDCKSMFIIIGPNWINAVNANGQRRLFDPTDFVRYEIAYALSHGKFVIPVLVKNGRMPTAYELPPDLVILASCPPLIIRNDPYFVGDVDILLNVAKGAIKQGPNNPVTLSIALVSALCIPVELALAAVANQPLVRSQIIDIRQLAAALFIIALVGMTTIVPTIFSILAEIRSFRTRRWGWFLAFAIPLAIALFAAIIGPSAPFVFAVFVVTLPATIAALIAYGFAGPLQPPKYTRFVPQPRMPQYIPTQER